MMNKSIVKRFLSLGLAVAGFVLIGGSSTQVQAQTDPFAKPGWAKPRTSAPTSTGSTSSSSGRPEKPKPAGPPPVVMVLAPGIEQRIAFYKQQREAAALNGLELPKVTSVLTLDEMAVIGIFRTPRGYAAMVEAKPIKLSYTIYPGEKFFDGQLVAIEENRLVFRKVTKMSNNKFTASVENKTLQQYSVEQEVQGTAPSQSGGKVETANNTAPASKEPSEVQNAVPTGAPNVVVVPPAIVISPLDEMNRQPVEQPKDSAKEKNAKGKNDSKAGKKAEQTDDKKADKKGSKKSTKVAQNKKS
jgi:hypothetical protein